ncbi:MAG: glutamate--tRNA ligase [Candidatus Bathyarchaeia archaeon]|nr:glutamate--tRNA ligase [Candidatus Bathyarchaeota archaeon]
MSVPTSNLDSVKEEIRRLALLNALSHDGKAQSKPVLGKLLGEKPELKSIIKEVIRLVDEIVEEVNEIPIEEQIRIVGDSWPGALARERVRGKAEEKVLPPLPNIEKYERVTTRFAPNPDCVLHLGSARAIILSHEYARMYRGRFILRFEDTDPRLKKSSLQFMDLIRDDLDWLGCHPDEEYVQSDRIEIYYDYAEKMLNDGYAYICTCPTDETRKRIRAGEPCPCRSLKPEENIRRWEAMLNGTYAEGEAVMRIKTDLDHPNPAVRDWPAFRIIDAKRHPHPRVGSKYRVWPLYNFACGVDDHLIGITHIIRGKEHLTNQERQKYLYRHLGWEYPEAIHYGRLKIEGASLSKSKILRGVREGLYAGWDDPRLATFLALRRRGIKPEAIRRLILEIGPRPADITLSWDNLYAYNRKIIDREAERYFFIWDPVELTVKNISKEYIAQIPLHPDYPNWGKRIFQIKPVNGEAHFLISGQDAKMLKPKVVVRLMELFNIEIENISEEHAVSSFHSETYSEARKIGAQLIHWIPENTGLPCEIIMPDNSVVNGLVEDNFRGVFPNKIVQFERFGFARIERVYGKIVAVFTHR